MVIQYQQLFESIAFQSFGHDVEVLEFNIINAGLLNTGARILTDEGPFFVKLNESTEPDFFEAEALDLELISQWLPCPKVLSHGSVSGHNYMLMELIGENDHPNRNWAKAAHILATLHQQTRPQFGFDRPNYLASIPQKNDWKSNGVVFLAENRILAQAGLCLLNEEIPLSLFKEIEALTYKLDQIIPNEPPALLHGDLWSGNLIFGEQNQPYFIDPASYYGLRESEIAFTFLFGGFEPTFYEAYLEAFPILPGFNERVSVYHLHPLLVHVHLFGEAYVPGIQRIIKRFQ